MNPSRGEDLEQNYLKANIDREITYNYIFLLNVLCV